MCLCVCVCACVCMRACVRACVRVGVCVCARVRTIAVTAGTEKADVEEFRLSQPVSPEQLRASTGSGSYELALRTLEVVCVCCARLWEGWRGRN